MFENNGWLNRFRSVYKPLLNDDYDEFELALSSKKSRHIRLARSRNIDYFNEFEDTSVFEKSPDFDDVYKISEDFTDITSSLSFETGGFYIMNPSSVVPAKLLVSEVLKYNKEPFVLDVSAAPGGKTCAISDYLGRRGFVIANEFSEKRLKSLNFNLEKYGAYNVRSISADGRLLSKFFPNSFDAVLLDAPCSNENKIFRDKTVQKEWSIELTERMATLQKQLIISAYDCLKEGGILAYSTCTMSVSENETVVKYLLDKYENAELLKIDKPFGGRGLSGDSHIDEKVARIMPSSASIDGFFVALIKKGGELTQNFYKYDKMSPKEKSLFESSFGPIPNNISINSSDSKGYIETSGGNFSKIPFRRRGMNIYKSAGDNLEPMSQAVWEFGSYVPENKISLVTLDNAKRYMKGFDIDKGADYNSTLLFYKNIPVGYAKIVGNMFKNKLDRYFLYGKNIEW